jgi:hypothetical protein
MTKSTGVAQDNTDGSKEMLPGFVRGGSVGSVNDSPAVGDGCALAVGLDPAVELLRLMPIKIRPTTIAMTTTTPMMAATRPMLIPEPGAGYP